ncbi:hypothetical protein PUNSTDRAFT_99280 [Punctularia strigosozonata HHB-11173 SS5]|uniref:uncharacterized protein n=1 Tax=Punctularia strigosozonata (strain HHB-11173) TaxID=741275 RepID=UPI00044164CD|nr:uncharacterized protein PUNSTDRAFT_99280 [Punctularia strigosozonata HHB-11173 SS5]EIN11936.1 hypothetical protein PUNSTDRAFT_99280 [Punctularia strigosozonata HHB-11173 SS5]
MSDVRQRRAEPATGSKSNEDATKHGPSSSAAKSRQGLSTLAYVALSYVAVGVAYLALRRPQISRSLPHAYAICSPEGAKIYTADDQGPQVQCLVVDGDRFLDVGSIQSVTERWQTHGNGEKLNVRFIESSSIVVPGLSDSHGHTLEYGASRQIPLESAKSSKEAVSLVREYILSNPDILANSSKFIEGWGWDHTSWPRSEWPTAADFDEDPLVKGRPVVLQQKDGHALWVSPKVLEQMTPIPYEVEGGYIRRDSSGLPTGVFLDNAQELVKRPALTDEDLLRRFQTTVNDAHARGLTTVHDAGFDPTSLSFFKRQSEKAPLPIRIYGMTFFDEEAPYWGDTKPKLIDNGTTRLTARSVKIFADGALRSGGAALYEPYTDNPSTKGFMRLSSEVLTTVIPRFLHDGWQVNIHAIGDRANGLVLDAFESALSGVNVTALRPRLEHAQIMTEGDMSRLGRLGVIASVQPTHAISDMWYAEDRLGPERVKMLYAFRSMVDRGARITLGSDFPVEDLNPMSGFYAAITRLSPSGTSPKGSEGWFPEQRLTREEALKAGMTLDPAYASFTEDMLGSITIGKRADYVILNQNIMTIPVPSILQTKVLATVIDGRPVFGTV